MKSVPKKNIENEIKNVIKEELTYIHINSLKKIFPYFLSKFFFLII
jgi:hypothetical protein